MSTVNTDAPISNFNDCHVGIIERLDALGELPELLDAAARAHEIAHRSLDFFKVVIFEHHQEEERELFPAVLESAEPGEERNRVEAMAQRLTEEHRSLEQLWKSLEKELAQMVAGKRSDVSVANVQALIASYRAHAAFEEAEFLPLSERILARNSHHMAALGLALHMRHAKPVRSYL